MSIELWAVRVSVVYGDSIVLVFCGKSWLLLIVGTILDFRLPNERKWCAVRSVIRIVVFCGHRFNVKWFWRGKYFLQFYFCFSFLWRLFVIFHFSFRTVSVVSHCVLSHSLSLLHLTMVWLTLNAYSESASGFNGMFLSKEAIFVFDEPSEIDDTKTIEKLQWRIVSCSRWMSRSM